MLVIKDNMVMDEIADHLNTGPTCGTISEQLPGEIEHPITVTEAAREQKNDSCLRERLDGDLLGVWRDRIRPGRCR